MNIKKTLKFGGIVLLGLILLTVLLMALACGPEQPEARSYSCAVYTEQGCAKYVVASGGELEIQSGGTFDLQSGATVDFSGGVDLDGSTLAFDADADTTMLATTDDLITVTVNSTSTYMVISTGNFKVGNGAPDTAQDGEDAYVEGGFEVDGTARFDGAVDMNSTLDMSNQAISNIGAAGTDFGSDGSLTTAQTLTVSAGGLTLSDGDAVVADDLRITAQTAITVTNGAAFTPTGSYQGLQVSAASSEVTPTLTMAGTAGDLLVLINTTTPTISIADSGTTMLSAEWEAGQYDTLVLWCDGTNWLELTRTNN